MKIKNTFFLANIISRERETERETHTERERQRETERDRERQRETERAAGKFLLQILMLSMDLLLLGEQ